MGRLRSVNCNCIDREPEGVLLLGLICGNVGAEALGKVLALLLHVLGHGCRRVHALLALNLVMQARPHEVAHAVAVTLQAPPMQPERRCNMHQHDDLIQDQ